MNKASVLELRQKILTKAKKEARRRLDAATQSLAQPRVERRLAVGYSRVKGNDYRLEIRVQRADSMAERQAESIREEAKGEANIDVIPRVEIPPHTRVIEGSDGGGRLSKRRRPLEIGLSIGHANGGAGSIGAFLGTPDGDCILSNNHVLALLDQAEPDDPIYQPGKPHQTPLRLGDRVARLLNANVMARGSRNEFDAATALIAPGVDYIPNVIPKGMGCPKQGQTVRRAAGYDALGPDKQVWKIGCTTGFTRGRVTAVGVSDLTIWTSAGNMVFDDVVEIRPLTSRKPFSAPGDSGSLVFTEELVGVGLHFAGGPVGSGGSRTTVSYCCSLQKVLKFFKAAMLS